MNLLCKLLNKIKSKITSHEDVANLLEKIIELYERSDNSNELRDSIIGHLDIMLNNPETMFTIDALRKYKKIDTILNDKNNNVAKKLGELRNPQPVQQIDQNNQHLLFARFLSLVMQKRVWVLNELAIELFGQKRENQKKEIQRVIINAMRYKLVDGKINQEEGSVAFTSLNAFFETPDAKDHDYIIKQLKRLI